MQRSLSIAILDLNTLHYLSNYFSVISLLVVIAKIFIFIYWNTVTGLVTVNRVDTQTIVGSLVVVTSDLVWSRP